MSKKYTMSQTKLEENHEYIWGVNGGKSYNETLGMSFY